MPRNSQVTRILSPGEPADLRAGVQRRGGLTMTESLRAYSAFRIRSFRIRRVTSDVTG